MAKESLTSKIQLANALFEPSAPLPEDGERIILVDCGQLHFFPDHPFKLRNLQQIADSIAKIGVAEPIIARPREAGGYEIISGHRRKEGCALAGLAHIPAIIRDMDDDAATILMVDSNLESREEILPSEKAHAYKMKLDAIKRQGARVDLTSTPLAGKLRGKESAEIVGEASGESKDQVRRYIRLTELVTPILDMVDENRMAFRPAVEISYLTKEQQNTLYEIMEVDEVSPSLDQANRLKQLSQEGKLDDKAIFLTLKEQKPNQKKLSIAYERIAKFIPKNYDTPQKQEDFIAKACEYFARHLQRQARQSER